MNMELNQAIMVKCNLWIEYLECRAEIDKRIYNKQKTTLLNYRMLKNIMNPLIYNINEYNEPVTF